MLGIALSSQRVYPLAFMTTTLLPMDSVNFFFLGGGRRLEAFEGGGLIFIIKFWLT